MNKPHTKAKENTAARTQADGHPASGDKQKIDMQELGFGAQELSGEAEPTCAQKQAGRYDQCKAIREKASQTVRAVWRKLHGNSIRMGGSNGRFKLFLKENKKNMLKISLLVCSVLCAMVLCIWYVNNDNKLVLEGTTVQYYAGQKYTVTDGSTLVRSLDDTTTMTGTAGDDYVVTSLVFYQEETDTIVLPQDMIHYDPRKIVCETVPALSSVTVPQDGGNIVAVNESKSTTLNKGFLYDGNNYYVFLEDVTVSINGYTIQLSALSYVEAIYQNYVMIFDYETKTCRIEQTDGEVVVTPLNEDYSINLIHDSLEHYDGAKELLFTRPDLLDTVFS